mmetsp:Transcript_80992/g.261717  ORF Transcript_80992/g.261717 Transcript_80992/m.261717 type:complete len:91 (+) Transcript_80992:807-1079(+)
MHRRGHDREMGNRSRCKSPGQLLKAGRSRSTMQDLWAKGDICCRRPMGCTRATLLGVGRCTSKYSEVMPLRHVMWLPVGLEVSLPACMKW